MSATSFSLHQVLTSFDQSLNNLTNPQGLLELSAALCPYIKGHCHFWGASGPYYWLNRYIFLLSVLMFGVP